MKSVLIISMLVALAVADVPRFSYCDEAKAPSYEFQIDLSQTTTEPKEIVKNIHAILDINGYFNDDVELTNLELDVYWAGTLLQKIDSPDTDKVSAYMPYTMVFGVDIPSFAMAGAYILYAYPKGKVAGAAESTLACLRVDFNI